MKQFFYSGIVIYITLLSVMTGGRLWAQVTQTDSVPVSSGQPSEKEIIRIKAALSQNISSSQVADTLLGSARKLAYLPGQVVALSQLASIQLQQQQTQQAAASMKEARQIAGQIRDLEEAGWAMTQVGRLQDINSRMAPSSVALFVPVMESLGNSMRSSASRLGRRRQSQSQPSPFESPNSIERRLPDRRDFPINPADFIPPMPKSVFDPTLNRHFRVKPDFADRLLDTLIHFDDSNPQLVRQLKERKKQRDSSQALSKAFAKEGDYAQAYRYYLQYSAYKDSLTAEATTRRLASLAYKQNLLKKEAQIQLLTKDQQLRDEESHRQRQYVFLMIGCIVLLAAFSFTLTRNNRAKQLANHQLSEQKEALQLTLAQLKTTQTQLIQSEKMASLGELTAGIAHEIQNPLNFVNNFSEVSTELVNELIESRQHVQRNEELENELLEDVQQNLQKISQHGSRASAIVKGMLEHARPSGGQKELTDLNALTEEYLKLAYHGIRAKDKSFDAKLTTVFDSGLSPVTVVPQEVGRVLLNIFNNAFYAVQKRQQSNPLDYHPEVAVKTSKDANQIKIKVRDNGSGIPEPIKQKIFQPFFTTKPTGQGTGLGLSLSYDIITKGHGGALTVESEEGQFTEFTIALPASV
ncbi:sensor histidine kinase [Spirosoma flavum]|uniref:histidine kinase n=1 Tax=Spirosoma flavum TaxID=2048557 RepID=A0ABW6AFH1_9BACT